MSDDARLRPGVVQELKRRALLWLANQPRRQSLARPAAIPAPPGRVVIECSDGQVFQFPGETEAQQFEAVAKQAGRETFRLVRAQSASLPKTVGLGPTPESPKPKPERVQRIKREMLLLLARLPAKSRKADSLIPPPPPSPAVRDEAAPMVDCIAAVVRHSPQAETDWQNLLIKVLRDAPKAVRLVQLELDELKRKGLPEVSIADLLHRANERWERENRG